MSQALPLYSDQFGSLGSLAQAVVRAELGGYVDPRLAMAAALGANERVPSEGGFLIPDALAADLWARAYAQGELLARCARQPVTTDRPLKVPAIDERSRANGSRFGGVRVYWADEAATVAASPMQFSLLRLEAKKLLALAYVTDELLRDAAALGAWLERMFALEASFVVEDQIVNGSGAGRPLGILGSDAVVTVPAEAGQAAGTVVAANVRDMVGRLWVGNRRQAVWLVHPDLEGALETLETAAGAPMYSYSPDGTPRLTGRLVIPCEYCAPVGSRGDVILADLNQYLVAERAPDMLSSIHVSFLADECVFRFR